MCNGGVMAAIFSVLNWTTRETTGPYDTEAQALEDLPNRLSDGDEYTVWKMPARVGAAEPVAEGRFKTSS